MLHARSVRVWANGQRLSFWLMPGQKLPPLAETLHGGEPWSRVCATVSSATDRGVLAGHQPETEALAVGPDAHGARMQHAFGAAEGAFVQALGAALVQMSREVRGPFSRRWRGMRRRGRSWWTGGCGGSGPRSRESGRARPVQGCVVARAEFISEAGLEAGRGCS